MWRHLTIGTVLFLVIAGAARAQGIEASGRVLEGPVVDGLLDAVADSHATLIVIGSHGRGGLARAFLGSITEELLRHATVPVLVAPHVTATDAAA